MADYTRRKMIGATSTAAAGLALSPLASARPARRLPNFIVILCDDLGYGDVQPYGGTIPTPHISRMAREGLLATDYYAPANACTPTRAALLTGRYAIRSGLGYSVILAGDERGLPLSERTIATALKPDYATALVGKWHLGQVAPYWPPTRHGFDTFFGIPYSHDIAPLELYRSRPDGSVEEVPFDLHTLQDQFCKAAEAFVTANRDRPFFLELALSAPHLPSYPNKTFDGKARQGSYGDVVMEVDAIVGRINGLVDRLGLARDTLIIFTSDNGPWFEGSTAGLRDRKGAAGYDGGYRVPFIARQPGTVAAGRKSASLIAGIDLLPTFCALAGKAPPPGVELDGKDISGILHSRTITTPHDEIVLFQGEEVVGIRTQRWKFVEKSFSGGNLINTTERGYDQLYDLSSTDQADRENYSVAARYPDVVADMKRRLADAKAKYEPFAKGVPPYFRKRMDDALDKQIKERAARAGAKPK